MLTNHNRMSRFAGLIAFCLFLMQPAPAQNSAPLPTAQQIVAKVDGYMNAAVKSDNFSGSVLITRDGQPIVSKGYGMANYELNVPNTPQTVFPIASVTKQFTAMAIMILQERGKLNVNDSICKYLENCPPAWQPITIQHLMTHTSGIFNYTATTDWQRYSDVPPAPAEIVNMFRDKPLEFTPGDKWSYSNAGYYLLGLIMEKVSSKPYAEFLRDNIFTPLGMKNTGYDDSRTLIPNRASGYKWTGKSLIKDFCTDRSLSYSSGAIYSTTEDLLLWDKALYTDKLVSTKTLVEIFTPFKEGYNKPGYGYAYGWGVGKMFDRQAAEHGGRTRGYSAYVVRFPAERVTVIFLNNVEYEASRSMKFGSDLSAIVFGAPYQTPGERKSITLPSATLEAYVGQYQLGRTSILTITNENGKLMAQATGRSKYELFAESETTFFPKAAELLVTFIKDERGKVTGLIMQQGVYKLQAQKIK